MSPNNTRDARQRDIVPPDRLAACRISIIGVGAVGRQVALQLAAMGASHLHLVDPDQVETVNLACQGYFETDLGRPKVEATAEICRKLNPRIDLRCEICRYRSSTAVGDVLLCCVDDIEVRRRLWQTAGPALAFFADGRMSAEVVRILTAADSGGREHYPTTLFAAGEAYQGACTARSTIFAANIAAGLMLGQLSKWLRRLPVEKDIMLNLLSAEWTVEGGGPIRDSDDGTARP